VQVLNLQVDGRADQPLGLDNTTPTLAWQMAETSAAAAHRCYNPSFDVACPGDEQTAYQVQAATSESGLGAGDLLWDSGKVRSNIQTGIPYAGEDLTSRERVVWRVRVWDADGKASGWSTPSSWEMGLLNQSDWGSARWIE
jgi:alpha-L-rhamnosidase